MSTECLTLSHCSLLQHLAILALTPISTSLFLGAQNPDLSRLLPHFCGPWTPPLFSHHDRCFQKEHMSLLPSSSITCLKCPIPFCGFNHKPCVEALFPVYILARFVQPLLMLYVAQVQVRISKQIIENPVFLLSLSMSTCMLSLFPLLKSNTWGTFQTFSLPWPHIQSNHQISPQGLTLRPLEGSLRQPSLHSSTI